jgi:hypothetical protein
MDGMKPPHLPEPPVGVVSAERWFGSSDMQAPDFTGRRTPPSSCC